MSLMELQPGSHVGSYTVRRRIGAGGMGEVWEAEDTLLHRRVALKVLKPAVSVDEESRARLLREARTAAQLNHPNIATIHSMEQQNDAVLIVMEFVEGEPLSQVIARGAVPEADVCAIGKGVCAALSAAHAKGIIHRDIKPDNIIIGPDGGVKVLDFGIAKQVGAARIAGTAPTFTTEAGVIVGTVYYMSPEQALGRELDTRTDIFSLGAVLYEAVTGRLPFEGATATEVILKLVRDDPPAPRQFRPALSVGMEELLQRCLAKNREQRFASADEFAVALDRVALGAPTKGLTERIELVAQPTVVIPETRPPKRPVVLWAAGLLVFAALVAAVGVSMWRKGNVPERAQAPAAVATVAPASPEAPVVTATPLAADPATTGTAPATTIDVAPTPAQAPSPGKRVEPVPTEVVAEEQPAEKPTADALYADAVRLLAEGRRPAAAVELRNVVRIDPAHAPAHLKLGELLAAAGQLRPARAEFLAALGNRDRLSGREALLAEFGAAAIAREAVRAREVGAELEAQYPGDAEFGALRRALGAGQPRPMRRR
jgi:tetratricopeptide (TPR) repeat protein/predicted Ser/Thr protein kinase